MTIVTLVSGCETRIPETARATAAGREGDGCAARQHGRLELLEVGFKPMIGCLVVGVQARLRQHGHSLRFVAWCQRSRVYSEFTLRAIPVTWASSGRCVPLVTSAISAACPFGHHVKSRYPDDSLAPAPPRHSPAGLGRSVDPVGFASGVGEGSVGFDRVVFDRVDSEQFAVL